MEWGDHLAQNLPSETFLCVAAWSLEVLTLSGTFLAYKAACGPELKLQHSRTFPLVLADIPGSHPGNQARVTLLRLLPQAWRRSGWGRDTLLITLPMSSSFGTP